MRTIASLVPLVLVLSACSISSGGGGDGGSTYNDLTVPTSSPTFGAASGDLSGTTVGLPDSGVNTYGRSTSETSGGTTTTGSFTDVETLSAATHMGVAATAIATSSDDPDADGDVEHFALADDGWIWVWSDDTAAWELLMPGTLNERDRWTVDSTVDLGGSTVSGTRVGTVQSLSTDAPGGILNTGTVHVRFDITSSGTILGLSYDLTIVQDLYIQPGVGTVYERVQSSGSVAGSPFSSDEVKTLTMHSAVETI